MEALARMARIMSKLTYMLKFLKFVMGLNYRTDHAFFDTVLIEQCLFDNPLKQKQGVIKDPFQIS